MNISASALDSLLNRADVYKPKNTVLKILIFHRKQFLGKLQYQNTVDQN
jgi:hypothetical protein